jgi:cytidylate kinase
VARDVVCISYASGAGGEEVARLVADRLGYLFVNEEIISRAAERAGIDPETVAGEERRKSMFENLMEAMAHGGAATGVPPVFADEVPSESVRAYIREAVQEVAERGNAVIVAHAASYAVRLGARQLRVLITAPREARSARLGTAEGLDELEAGRLVKRSDAGRVDYLKRFYGVGQELPIHYDLVLNTEMLSVDEAAALIVQATASETSPAAARSL